MRKSTRGSVAYRVPDDAGKEMLLTLLPAGGILELLTLLPAGGSLHVPAACRVPRGAQHGRDSNCKLKSSCDYSVTRATGCTAPQGLRRAKAGYAGIGVRLAGRVGPRGPGDAGREAART